MWWISYKKYKISYYFVKVSNLTQETKQHTIARLPIKKLGDWLEDKGKKRKVRIPSDSSNWLWELEAYDSKGRQEDLNLGAAFERLS